MKIVVIGGTGLIGSKVVAMLETKGHRAIAASPRSGVNAVTGEGLEAALGGASVVIDVSNPPSFDDHVALEFFSRSGQNLASAEKAAGVKHHVALSVVGTERLQNSGYFRAKLAQEELVVSSGIPWTLVRATQFYEFVGTIAEASTANGVTRATSAAIQPIAASDVAAKMVELATIEPANAMIEIAGPERMPLAQLLAQYYEGVGDTRAVLSDETATYFGVAIDDRSLTPEQSAWTSTQTFQAWLVDQMTSRSSSAERMG